MGQNTSNSVWKPCEDLQKMFDLCHCQQRVYNKVLRWNFVIDQILIFHHNLQINSLKILQCDFLDFISYFVSHSWGISMMKITGLSHLFKWENLHNWWLTKYFFAPLYKYSLLSILFLMVAVVTGCLLEILYVGLNFFVCSRSLTKKRFLWHSRGRKAFPWVMRMSRLWRSGDFLSSESHRKPIFLGNITQW